MPFNFNGNNPTSITYNGNTVNTLVYNGTTVWTAGPSGPSGPNYLCFTANTAGSTVSMSTMGSNPPVLELYYSTDRTTWNTFTVRSTTITLTNVGDKVYFKGVNDTISINSNYNYFVMTGSIAASGDLTTILEEIGVSDLSLTNARFDYLFYNCTALTLPPLLLATVLSNSCYSNMFYGCTNLEALVNLPATTLTNGCYNSLYYNCRGIKVSATYDELEYPTAYTFGAVPDIGTANNIFYGTSGTATFSAEQQTYYTSNTIVS